MAAKISYSNDPAALAADAKTEHVVLFASAAALEKEVWRKALKGRWASVLKNLVEDTKPGLMGKCVSTYIATGGPRRVTFGVLPNDVSRHNTPTRGYSITQCARSADLDSAKSTAVILVLDDPSHYPAAASAVARALPLVSYRSSPKKSNSVTISAMSPTGAPIEANDAVKFTAEAVRWSASMVMTPTADLTTQDFAREARKLFKSKGKSTVKAKVIVGDDLLKQNMGGIHGVGRTAVVAPRLLILDYSPKKKPKRTAVLVGKGVVYDTGGLSLKPSAGMFGMKCDMGGAAAVTGAFYALVKTKVDARVICLVPLAENAIGPNSYRPDDVLKLHSGKTVEINNTDAEGRLLLADAASYGARTYKPDLLIDAATLTGAQLLATGKKHAAVVSNRDGLERLAVLAGRSSGDLTHPLPFAPEFFKSEFKSEVADMTNSVKDRANAQSSCAAQFVYNHIEDLDLPWLHVDLAGPAFPNRFATGFGAALIAEIVRNVTDADLK